MRFLPATAVAALALGLLSGSAAFAADGQDRGAQGTQDTQHQNDKNDKGDKNNRGAKPPAHVQTQTPVNNTQTGRHQRRGNDQTNNRNNGMRGTDTQANDRGNGRNNDMRGTNTQANDWNNRRNNNNVRRVDQPNQNVQRNDNRRGMDVARFRRNFDAPRRYNAGQYHAPRGYNYRRYGYGQRLPRDYYARNFWLSDFLTFGLLSPPDGYVWVRYGPDALLIDEETGEIIQVQYNVFYS